MSVHPIILLGCYVISSTGGLVLLKKANELLSVQFALGFGLYGIGFLIWYALLKTLPLAVAFPLASGALIVATQLAGFIFLSEAIAALHLAGITAILLGLVMIGISGAALR